MKRLLGAVVFFLIPTLAHASPITFGFTGVIQACFFCNVTLPPGTTFQGQYTFDDSAAPSPTGSYTFLGEPYGGFVQVAGITITWEGLQIGVGNDIPQAIPGLLSDRYFVMSSPFSFGLWGCNGNIFQDTSLPLVPVDPSLFHPSCSFGDEVVFHAGPQIIEAFGSLSTLFAVPEAPAWLVFGFGLIMVGFQRRLS